jgi:uncharacterized protein (TIRG00374 family)
MKEKILIVFSIILGFALFFSLMSTIEIKHILLAFKEARFFYIIPFLLCSFLIFFTLTFKWSIILQSYNYRIPLSKLIRYKACGFAAGYLTPSALFGGDSIKAIFLKKHQIPYKTGFSISIIDKSIEMTINLLFTTFGFIFLILHLAVPTNTIFVVTFGLIIAIGILFLFYYRLMRRKAFFSLLARFGKLIHHSFFSEMEANFKEIEDNISLVLALILSLVAWIFTFAEYELLLLMFGHSASISILFLIIAVTGLAYIIPIPAALGVLEGGHASLFKYSNMDVGKGFAFSTTLRVRDLFISLLGLLYAAKYGLTKKGKWLP